MKKIVIILLLIVLIISGCLLGSCSGKENIKVRVSCAYMQSANLSINSFIIEYDENTDIQYMYLSDELPRTITLTGYVRADDTKNPAIALYGDSVKLSGTYTDGATTVDTGCFYDGSSYCFFIKNAGRYVLTFEVNPPKENLQSRTVTLIVDVGPMKIPASN